MQHPFSVLQSEYTALLAAMTLTREAALESAAKRLVGFIDAGHYKPGCDQTGVPQKDAATSFEREASSNFRDGPAQGDPIDRVSVHVPRGIGPFSTWTGAQIKAYQIDGLDKIGAQNWTWERSCYEWELFNGFGYRSHGIHSPYLWAGSNIYERGKYVADGVWSASAVDSQLGVIPMMYCIARARPDLALPIPFPTTLQAVATVPPPQAPPAGLHDAATLQADLNNLPAAAFADGYYASRPLTVDGSYGRETKRAVMAFQKAAGITVDGLAGPQTWAAISQKLEG